MKKKIFALLLLAACTCLCLCAFQFDKNSSVKTLTKPYIATYDCIYAQLGNEDLLEKYDYLKITFLNDKELEVSFKRKKGKRHAYTCEYFHNDQTGAIKAEVGILGFKFRQETVIKNGRFNINMPILGKQLSMTFSS